MICLRPFFAVVMLVSATASADVGDSSTREVKRGFFSVGGTYFLGSARFLNTDGSFSTYGYKGWGPELDVLLWGAGSGDIRLFVKNLSLQGNGRKISDDTITTSETSFGIKFFVGSYLYLAGAWGTGSTTLESPRNGISKRMSYDVMSSYLGIEFPLTESLFLGLEGIYRNAAVRVDRNSELSQNTYFESLSCGLRLIWSPPSVTITNTVSRPR